MFWEEDKDENTPYTVPEDVLDLIYQISCKCLPLDHAHAFSVAIRKALPWIDDEPMAGVHLVHGAESGNGWMRPEDASNELLHLSKRSRMTLRIPGSRIEDAGELTGAVLDIEGYRLEIGKMKTRLFSALPTQFARYVVVPDGMNHEDEEAFMRYAAEQVQSLEVPVRKLLCGRTHVIQHPAQCDARRPGTGAGGSSSAVRYRFTPEDGLRSVFAPQRHSRGTRNDH